MSGAISVSNSSNFSNSHQADQERMFPFSDPRPDLTEDHWRWETFLYVVHKNDQAKLIFGLLHGLRCGGAHLIEVRTKNGTQWKLDYKSGMLLSADRAKPFEQLLLASKDRLIVWLKEAQMMLQNAETKVSS
jgi:hypothetical protein